MLCGSALTYWSVGAIWDVFVPQRWGDGLHKRTGQDPCAQRQTSNARKNLWWVSSNGPFLFSASLELSLPTRLSSRLSLHSLSCACHIPCFLSLVPQSSLSGHFNCGCLIDRFLFWLLIDWPKPDASWDAERGQMSIVSPGQTLQHHTQIALMLHCSKLNQPLVYTHVHTNTDIEEYLLITKCVAHFL